MSDSAVSPPRLARFGTAAAFFLDGATIASWVTRIPAMQERLRIGNATLGLALLMTNVGALIAMPIMGRLVARRGSRGMTVLAAMCFGAMLILPGMATSVIALGIALLMFGMGFGAVDIAMNAQAVTVERQYGRPIMANFHAMFSLGGVAGGLIGSLAAAHQMTPTTHFLIVSVAVIVVAASLQGCLLNDQEPYSPSAGGPERSHRRHLAFLGAIAFCAAMGEGAMADWSADFLRQVSLANAATAALGFTAFSTFMTVGRLVGDRATIALGAVRIVRLGGTLAAGGLVLAMALPGASTAIIGFGLVGAGLAALIPTVFSAAGRLAGIPPAIAIATVSMAGYSGFLFGPPVIGFVSQASSLRWAIGLVVVCCGLAIALAKQVEPATERSGDESITRPIFTAVQELL